MNLGYPSDLQSSAPSEMKVYDFLEKGSIVKISTSMGSRKSADRVSGSQIVSAAHADSHDEMYLPLTFLFFADAKFPSVRNKNEGNECTLMAFGDDLHALYDLLSADKDNIHQE